MDKFKEMAEKISAIEKEALINVSGDVIKIQFQNGWKVIIRSASSSQAYHVMIEGSGWQIHGFYDLNPEEVIQVVSPVASYAMCPEDDQQ